MARHPAEIAAIVRTGRILEELPLDDRTYVLDLLRNTGTTAAKAAARIAALLEGLSPTARARVLTLVVGQVSEAIARKHGDREGGDADAAAIAGNGDEGAAAAAGTGSVIRSPGGERTL